MTIVYIHGAKATSNSFNYIRTQIKNYNEIVLSYNSDKQFYDNLMDMISLIEKTILDKDTLFFVAHSLGGIYAVHLADYFRVATVGGCTISTPYNGSHHAMYLKYLTMFSSNKSFLLNDITPYSEPIVEVNKIKLAVPWTNIVTLGCNIPLFGEPNDGVVTVKSMKYKKNIQLLEIDSGHFEVLLSPVAVGHIKNMLHNINK